MYSSRHPPKFEYAPNETPLSVYSTMEEFLDGKRDNEEDSVVLENIWRLALYYYFHLGEGFMVHEYHCTIDDKKIFEFVISTLHGHKKDSRIAKTFFFVRVSTEDPVYGALVQKQIKQIETVSEMLPFPKGHYLLDEVYGIITGGRTTWFCKYRRVIEEDGSEKWEAEQMPVTSLKDPLAPIQIGKNYLEVFAAMVDIKKRGFEATCDNPRVLESI